MDSSARIVTETLTDGSKAYNVVVTLSDEQVMNFAMSDRYAAHDLCFALNRAIESHRIVN